MTTLLLLVMLAAFFAFCVWLVRRMDRL